MNDEKRYMALLAVNEEERNRQARAVLPPKQPVVLKFYSVHEYYFQVIEYEYHTSLYSNSTQRRAALYSTQLIVIRGPPVVEALS